MMDDAVDRWHQTAEAFTLRFDAIGIAQWEGSTPCSEWSVRDLVDHAIATQARFGTMLGVESAPAGWSGLRTAMSAVLAEPSALSGTVTVPGLGELSKEQILDICTNDLLIHTWDLARAIGAEESLPVGPVAACLTWLQQLPVEVLRSPGHFAEAVPLPATDDVQARMLAFAGRTP